MRTYSRESLNGVCVCPHRSNTHIRADLRTVQCVCQTSSNAQLWFHWLILPCSLKRKWKHLFRKFLRDCLSRIHFVYVNIIWYNLVSVFMRILKLEVQWALFWFTRCYIHNNKQSTQQLWAVAMETRRGFALTNQISQRIRHEHKHEFSSLTQNTGCIGMNVCLSGYSTLFLYHPLH